MCKNKESDNKLEENGQFLFPSKMSLESNISNSVLKAEELRSKIGAIDYQLQMVIDQGNVTRPLIPYMTNLENENMNEIWSGVSGQIDILGTQLVDISPTTDVISGSASISTAYVSGFYYEKRNGYDQDETFRKLFDDFFQVTSIASKNDDVLRLLKTLHLDCPQKGKMSAMEQFKLAHDAYERPLNDNNPVISSLIPMRQAVDTAIIELLRLCPKQEKVGSSDSKKILAIGKHLKKELVTDAMIQMWAEEWDRITNKDLSSSKNQRITREEWSRRLFRATQFFHGLLSGVDPNKLRHRQ